MNTESSRSHAIFVIKVTQKLDVRVPCQSKDSIGGRKPSLLMVQKGSTRDIRWSKQVVERHSKVYLIDLGKNNNDNNNPYLFQ